MLRLFGSLLCLSLSVVAWGDGPGRAAPASPNRDAQDLGVWQSVGPAPPAIEAAVASDPASHTLYVAALGGGVYKSTDDGATFASVSNEMGDDAFVGSLVMNPRNPNILYADGAKTVDGGAHWFASAIYGVTMIIDPNNPKILYAGDVTERRYNQKHGRRTDLLSGQ